MSTSSEVMESKPFDLTDSNTKHDRVLIVGGKKFYVVSGILSLWSDYFGKLFEQHSEEAKYEEIELKDIDPNIFEEFLRILYDSRLANFGECLLIPLMDLSFTFVAPKVLDECIRFIYGHLPFLTGSILVKLLLKACEKNLDNLKTSIVEHVKHNVVMDSLEYRDVVDYANKYKLDDLKNWVGTYLVKKVTPEFCSDWLDYSLGKDLPTLKTAIIEKIATWDHHPANYYQDLAKKPLITEDRIIELVKCAFKHDVDILKVIIRKRIFHLARGTDKMDHQRENFITVNTFLEKNLEKIYGLPQDIREFIITSTISDI